MEEIKKTGAMIMVSSALTHTHTQKELNLTNLSEKGKKNGREMWWSLLYSSNVQKTAA